MMLNDVRRFSTHAYPEALRHVAWAEVLEKVRLAPHNSRCKPVPDAYVSSYRSPGDSVFVQIASSPQVLAPQCAERGTSGRGTILVVALLAGRAEIADTGKRSELAGGDIVLLDPGASWELHLLTDFRAMVVKLESAAFVLRLVRTGDQTLNRITTRSGIGAVCLNLMQSVADELSAIGRGELPQIETTLIELLVTCLSRKDGVEANEDATSVQLAHMRRICRAIETRLGTPELSIDDIAAQEALSTRYIQKLFQSVGTSFGAYLRGRRLERCRADLANPALAHFSITELCFRWGFNDAANFSRAFSASFGASPKAYRAAPPGEYEEHLLRGRPSRGRGSEPTDHDPASPNTKPHGQRRSRPLRNTLSDHTHYALAFALMPKRALPQPELQGEQARSSYYYLPVSSQTVHWGYFNRGIKPVLTVRSGDVVTIETLTQHASDDCERMVEGDPGAESVFAWTADGKAVERRGAGPMDASIFGRGAGEGFGVHICTGPIHVHDAEPGDVLEVRILDIVPRPSRNPEYRDRSFGSNAATWWGFQYSDLLTEPRKREVVTIYEILNHTDKPHAKAVYNFRWTPQTDPFGVCHETIDYPGVPVDHSTIEKKFGILEKAVVPVRPHFGVIAVAPKEAGMVDSIPPGYFGGNLDNWRAGKGASLFLPVSVDGALFSVGDPHASQGDSEACGTAIECSLTGVFQLVLHKKAALGDGFLAELDYPFLETPEEWVIQGLSYPNYLAELGPNAQTQVYKKSTLEDAMRDAFRKTRHYLMKAHQLSEDEAISLISVGVDFGITQVVDGNLGIHAVIRKALFPDG